MTSGEEQKGNHQCLELELELELERKDKPCPWRENSKTVAESRRCG